MNESAVTQKIKATAAASSSADSHYRYQILTQPKSRLGALLLSPHAGKQCYIPVNTDTNNTGEIPPTDVLGWGFFFFSQM